MKTIQSAAFAANHSNGFPVICAVELVTTSCLTETIAIVHAVQAQVAFGNVHKGRTAKRNGTLLLNAGLRRRGIMPIDKSRYPSNWEEISRRIRFERAGGRCEWCGAPNGKWIIRNPDDRAQYHVLGESLHDETLALESPIHPTLVILTVHHRGITRVDGRPGDPHDKMDCRDENLAALCQRCHWIADLPIHIQRAQEARRIKRHERRYAGMLPLFVD